MSLISHPNWAPDVGWRFDTGRPERWLTFISCLKRAHHTLFNLQRVRSHSRSLTSRSHQKDPIRVLQRMTHVRKIINWFSEFLRILLKLSRKIRMEEKKTWDRVFKVDGSGGVRGIGLESPRLNESYPKGLNNLRYFAEFVFQNH